METQPTPPPLTPLEVEMLAALKLAHDCMTYCRRAHKDAQSGEGAPAEFFIADVIAKAQARAAAPAPEVEG